MSLCHNSHYPYACDDDTLHHQAAHYHHHHHHHHGWCQSWHHSSCLTGQVSITNDEGFQLQIDVHHFNYDDIKVKAIGEWIIVEGKQSNDSAEPVCITKQFSRKYKLPRNYDSSMTTSTLSSDGILLVQVPPPDPEPEVVEKIIEIEKTESKFNDVKSSGNKVAAKKGGGKKNDNDNESEDKNGNKSSKEAEEAAAAAASAKAAAAKAAAANAAAAATAAAATAAANAAVATAAAATAAAASVAGENIVLPGPSDAGDNSKADPNENNTSNGGD